MERLNYCPVVIPTLNRYELFKRCLESLERCTGADKTDVYVGLDYPPSEKYVEGWKKIDAYLHEKEILNGFNKLCVLRRDHNYGVCKENSNSSCLVKEVLSHYDTYILSEDDSEFSPNALEYFNKGLVKFKDDQSVFAICGYDWGENKRINNLDSYYKARRFCAWGVARWREKLTKYNVEYKSLANVKRMLLDDDIRGKMRKNHPESLERYLNMLKMNQLWGDALIENFLFFEDMYCVFPTLSLVRNLGCDGTGEHSFGAKDKKIAIRYSNQTISEKTDFEFTGNAPILKIEQKRPLLIRIAKRILTEIQLYLFVHYGYLKK